MTTQKPFSQSCENNKQPILRVIETVFTDPTTVWEIGSGTGQHACYFAEQLPHLAWQPTDRAENLAGIEQWRIAAGLPNLHPPLCLDVEHAPWPCSRIQALFSANTLHIMSQTQVEACFAGLGEYLNAAAPVCFYGPFNYAGSYTSDSNARFDEWLKQRDPLSGIKHFENIVELAAQAGLELRSDCEMPANNRLLVFRKSDG
ncbi:DUF938 domain-containing protein [Methylomonas koyamae]|uniref:DUF938 domain-containing protein n=1 Tax=Methylomonas koyamae TaxID=702114 RepID=UPI00112B8719|nr:DUF938 domain-containing protein [Methylomonas koyamae]TPQ28716.1 methylase [Methylomonas koyamae]